MMQRNKPGIYILFLGVASLSATASTTDAQSAKVKFIKGDQKIDVLVDGKLFSSYRYPENMEKPILYPVCAPDGSVITRGFPLEPGKSRHDL
jgi:hypothetical protein